MKRLFAFLAIAAVTTVAATADLTAEQRTEVFGNIRSAMHKWAYLPGVTGEQLDALLDGVAQQVADAKSDNEFVDAVNGMFEKIDASHLVLLNPRQAQARTQGKVVGLGVELRMVDGEAHVTYVFPGSGADRIGLRPGDVILEIDGAPYDPAKGASGTPGTTFSVRYRTADGSTHSRRVVREEFDITKPALVKRLDDGTAYLRIWSFMQYPSAQIREALASFNDADRLVLDLRSNGGGSVFWMTDLLSYLLPNRTTVGAFLSKHEDTGEFEERPVTVRARDRARYTGEMVVLIDQASASASEIIAAALQETGRAVVLGRQSAGMVLSSMFFPVGEGFSVQLPRQDYKTAKGVRLEGAGVKPDLELTEEQVRWVPEGEPDPAVEMAVKVLSGAVRVPKTGA